LTGCGEEKAYIEITQRVDTIYEDFLENLEPIKYRIITTIWIRE